MSKLKAILFDIGNVILYFDNHRVSRSLSQITNHPERMIFKYVFSLYLEKELDLGKTPADEFLNDIKKELQLSMDIPSLKNMFSDIFTENLLVSDLIRSRLKWKIPLLAVSNTNESHFEYIQEHFPVMNLLDYVVLSYELGIKKPDPGIYFEALKLSRAKPQECLFIDDQEKNIIPAQKLGFKTHLYRSHDALVQLLYQYKIL